MLAEFFSLFIGTGTRVFKIDFFLRNSSYLGNQENALKIYSYSQKYKKKRESV